MRKASWFISAGAAVRVSLIALACLLVSATGAWADGFTYTYTGNDFTSASAPYTTSDSVTASFVLSSPLPPNLYDFTSEAPLVISYTMSDGVQTFTNLNSEFVFNLKTDSLGNITEWAIAAAQLGYSYNEIGTENGMPPEYGINDSTSFYGANAQILGDAGTWSPFINAPEPGTLVMLGIGLFGLAGVSRCKRVA